MTTPTLSEAIIRQQATAESFRRGRNYYQQGAVVSVIQRGNVWQAEVEGSEYTPYQVHIVFDKASITTTTCSCPYDWGGWCKHIVATLLTCLYKPETITVRPALEDLLANLDREQLSTILLQLTIRYPDLAEEIENQISLLQISSAASSIPQKAPSSTRHTSVDPKPIRRRVRSILHSLDSMRSSEAYWHVGSVVNETGQVLKQAQRFVESGDGRNALVVLEAITDTYVDGWMELDDSDGEASSFFEKLGAMWTEALLTADLTTTEREEWVERLAEWQDEISNYGVEEVFNAAQAAAIQGWDYPPLQRVLRGEITEQGAWKDEMPWYADDLAIARLNVLERQGRYQEYLYLAEAEGQIGRYLTMLARLGRVHEAVDQGLQHLATTENAFALAQVLRERGELESALQIAEHGLTLDGSKTPLATWLGELAGSHGETERALKAVMIAFRETLTLSGYLKRQELSGERWPGFREELLTQLRQLPSYYPQAQVDIFLHEQLFDDAIAAVHKGASYELLERVMDEVLPHRPEWVMQEARQQAERIMDSGKAQHYHYATS